MSEPRIRPGRLREIGVGAWVFARIAGRVAGTAPPHVFTTLARSRGLFWGWLHFAGRLMPGGKLPRRVTELVILRVAHLRGCSYEFEHHVRLGRRAGVTEADIASVQSGADDPGWTAYERAIMRATDALVRERDLDEELWRQLREHLDERRVIELLLLVGNYDMLATTLLTLRVQTDRER